MEEEQAYLHPNDAMAYLERQLTQGIDPLYVHPDVPEWAILDLNGLKVLRYVGNKLTLTQYESVDVLFVTLMEMVDQLKDNDLSDAVCDIELKLNDLNLWNLSPLAT